MDILGLNHFVMCPYLNIFGLFLAYFWSISSLLLVYFWSTFGLLLLDFIFGCPKSLY